MLYTFTVIVNLIALVIAVWLGIYIISRSSRSGHVHLRTLPGSEVQPNDVLLADKSACYGCQQSPLRLMQPPGRGESAHPRADDDHLPRACLGRAWESAVAKTMAERAVGEEQLTGRQRWLRGQRPCPLTPSASGGLSGPRRPQAPRRRPTLRCEGLRRLPSLRLAPRRPRLPHAFARPQRAWPCAISLHPVRNV